MKMGQLATRSPHRPNALGLSLVKVERIQGKRLYISALDLVNQTPVYDIKPCVPWDIPGYHQHTDTNTEKQPSALIVPDWVDQHDAMSQVEFTEKASQELRYCVERQKLLAPLYTESNGGYEGAVATLQEILAQDPRASRKRGTTTNKNKNEDTTYKIIFCRVQVEFVVESESTVQVVGVTKAEFLDDATVVDGVPLVNSNGDGDGALGRK